MGDETVMARFAAEGGDLLIHPDELEVGDGQHIPLDDVAEVHARGEELEIRQEDGGGATIRLGDDQDAADAEHIIMTLLSEAGGDERVTEGLEGSMGGALGGGSPPEMP